MLAAAALTVAALVVGPIATASARTDHLKVFKDLKFEDFPRTMCFSRTLTLKAGRYAFQLVVADGPGWQGRAKQGPIGGVDLHDGAYSWEDCLVYEGRVHRTRDGRVFKATVENRMTLKDSNGVKIVNNGPSFDTTSRDGDYKFGSWLDWIRRSR
jgi:hypothetical protein